MPSYHVKIKSAKPGTAKAHFEYLTRQDFVSPSKRQELVWCTSQNMPTWASGPGDFYATADLKERVNGAVYRELEITLPNELSLEQNIALVKKIADRVVGPRPAVLVIHEKVGAISNERHPHLHAMYSDRACDGIERTGDTYFARFNSRDPAKGGARKLSGGKTPAEVFVEVKETRKVVAEIINEFLGKEGILERVDHRTLKERGIRRLAEKPLGAVEVKTLSSAARTAILQSRADLR